jgi:serine/threonine protein kinase
MESVKGYTNIVSIEDYKIIEQDEGLTWYILIRMALLTPLNKYQQDNALNEADVIRLGKDLCTALSVCRKKNIIHRDIKPGNLLITAAGQLKLADLGLAGAGSTSAPGEIIATPLYMPPETAMGYGTSDVTGDIYSFGIMFYELSAGIPPFTGSIEELQKAHIEQLPPPLLAANPDMDPELARYIDSLLAKDPAMRPQSWGEVRQFLTSARKRLFAPERYILPAVEEADPEADRKAEKSRRETASWYIVIVFTLVFIIALITTIFLFLVK